MNWTIKLRGSILVNGSPPFLPYLALICLNHWNANRGKCVPPQWWKSAGDCSMCSSFFLFTYHSAFCWNDKLTLSPILFLSFCPWDNVPYFRLQPCTRHHRPSDGIVVSKTPILYRISIQKSSAKLSQFVSRNILSRDKMSQLLVACGLVLGACGFFYFLEPVIFVWHALAKITDPRSSLPVLKQGWTYSPLDQGSVPCCAHPSRDFNWSQIHCADDHLHLSQWIRDQAGACTIGAV